MLLLYLGETQSRDTLEKKQNWRDRYIHFMRRRESVSGGVYDTGKLSGKSADEKSELRRALEKPNVRTGGGKRRNTGSLDLLCAQVYARLLRAFVFSVGASGSCFRSYFLSFISSNLRNANNYMSSTYATMKDAKPYLRNNERRSLLLCSAGRHWENPWKFSPSTKYESPKLKRGTP